MWMKRRGRAEAACAATGRLAMLIRLFVLVMLGLIGRDFYYYSVEHNYEWVRHPYYLGIFVFWFAMLMLLRNSRFKY
jgi:hypothetical protein